MRRFPMWCLGAGLSCLLIAGCGDSDENNKTTNNATNNGENNTPTPKELLVVSTDPVDKATGIGLKQVVGVRFNLAVNPASFDESTASINPSIAGAWAWTDDKTLVFTPSVGWMPSTSYRVRVGAGIEPVMGSALAKDVSFDFSTASGDSTGETGIYTSGNDRVTVQIADRDSTTRTYTMKTTAALRDNEPADKQVVIKEAQGQAITRTGHDVFDALFAMAWEETRQNSVNAISDGAFNQGQGVSCECFETGAKWNYVWTRDTAYAVDLGLAFVDPQRAMRSLDFKLSERKGGGGIQIVQDTGSGGSYPVSTDRVVWSLGAWQVLKHLSGAERDAFRDKTFDALKNTIAQDRAMVFDTEDGLYRGEQSFLDWREQSYASRTRDNTVELGMSKALSTNVGHFAVLDMAAKLAAEKGDSSATEYRAWADALKASIQKELWLDDVGQFSTFKLYGVATKKYDMLGTSLAVLTGVASTEQARRAMASYPHVKMGPPVLWPQQPFIPIYHNRGIWPFVTAYAVLASKAVDNDKAFDLNMESLIRGAALNLSNMENFEFMTQQPWVDDGDYSGPVVNSRRQLWSVAGYLGAVVHGIFGFEATQDGVLFKPFVTTTLHETYFKGKEVIALKQLAYQGKKIDIEVVLPLEVSETEGVYRIEKVAINGKEVAVGEVVGRDDLVANATVRVTLGAVETSTSEVTIVEGENFQLYWSPRDPSITSLQLNDGNATVQLDSAGEDGVKFNIYENGEMVAQGVDGPSWSGAARAAGPGQATCFTVESYFAVSNNHSHVSQPVCAFDSARDISLNAYDMYVESGDAAWSTMHGKPHFQDFGEREDVLEIQNVQPKWTGRFQLSAEYGNGAGAINTGITAAVKWVEVSPMDDPTSVQRVLLVMPHLADWSRWTASTQSVVTLDSTKRYRVQIKDGINMSYFAHFEPYTGGLGGGAATYNNVNIHKIDLRLLDGQPGVGVGVAGLELNGDDDLSKFPAAQQLDPGATGAPWEKFALHWDANYLYGAIVSESFEGDYRPFMLYMEAAPQALGAAVASAGISYSNQVAQLPFTPTMALTFRSLSADGSSAPYNGLWQPAGNEWAQRRRFEQGKTWWISADKHTVSFKIPRAWLGGATKLRFAGHVVHAVAGSEWRVTVPATSTPWQAGGGYYEVDLSGSTDVSSWSLR